MKRAPKKVKIVERPAYLPDYVSVSTLLTPENTSEQQVSTPQNRNNIVSPKTVKRTNERQQVHNYNAASTQHVPFFSAGFDTETRDETPYQKSHIKMSKQRNSQLIKIVDSSYRHDTPIQTRHTKNPERELKSLLTYHRRQASSPDSDDMQRGRRSPDFVKEERDARIKLREQQKHREIAALGINAPVITKNARLKRNILTKGVKKQQVQPLQRQDSKNLLLAQFLSARDTQLASQRSSSQVLRVPRELRLSSKEEDTDLSLIHPKLFRNMFQHSQFQPSLSTQQSQKVLQYLLKEKVEPYGDMNQLILQHGLLNTTKEERNKAKSKELALQNQKRGKLFGAKFRSSLKSASPQKKKEDHLTLKKLFSKFIEDLEQTDKANEARREQRATEIKKAIESELAKFVPQKKKNSIQAIVHSKYGKNLTVRSGAEREKKIHGAQIIKEAGGKISALQSRTSKVPTQEPSPSKGKVTFIQNETERGGTEVTIEIKKEEATTAQHFQKFLHKKNIHTHFETEEDDSMIRSREFDPAKPFITEEDSLQEDTVNREVIVPDGTVEIQITSDNEEVKRETTPQRELKNARVQQLMEKPPSIQKSPQYRVNQSLPSMKPTKRPHTNLPIASVNRITELKRRSGSPLTKSFSQKPRSIKGQSPQDVYQMRSSSKRPNTSGMPQRIRTEPNETSYSHFKIAAIKSRQSTEHSGTTFKQDSYFMKRGNMSRFSQISGQSSYHFSSKHNPKRHGESFIIKGLESNKNIRQNLFSVSDIIQKCDKSVAGEIEELKKQNIKDQSEELKHFTNNIQRVMNNYMEMSHLNDKELENRRLENMFKEVVLNDAFDHENFTSQEELDKHRLDSKKCTMFIKHLGRRKLWKPDRFVMSRKVRVAQNFEDLQRE